MHRYDFEQWLDAWTRAWTFRDTSAFLQLLAPDIVWQRDPFSAPLRGHTAVREAVEQAFEALASVRYIPDAVAFDGDRGVARWAARLAPSGHGRPVMTDGVLIADFDEDGRCKRLEEWWHARPDE